MPQDPITGKGQAKLPTWHYKSVSNLRPFCERFIDWKSAIRSAWDEFIRSICNFPEKKSRKFVRCSADDPDKCWTMTTDAFPARYEIKDGQYVRFDPIANNKTHNPNWYSLVS